MGSNKNIKSVKGKFTEEDFDLYLTEKFSQGVILFNRACGKSMDICETPFDGLQMIVNESKRVLEENFEALKAYMENNTRERLDGFVDSLWTMTQLSYLYVAFEEKFGALDQKTMKQFSYDGELINLQIVTKLHPVACLAARSDLFNAKRVYLACELILANNTSKYTTDKAVADDWVANLEQVYGDDLIRLHENVVDGVTYYCLKRDSDDYICKPYNFKPVILEVE